jgi:phosphoketolase
MVVRNELDRFHVLIDVIDVPGLGYRAAHVRQLMRDKLSRVHHSNRRRSARSMQLGLAIAA